MNNNLEFNKAINKYKNKIGTEPYQKLDSLVNKITSFINTNKEKQPGSVLSPYQKSMFT